MSNQWKDKALASINPGFLAKMEFEQLVNYMAVDISCYFKKNPPQDVIDTIECHLSCHLCDIEQWPNSHSTARAALLMALYFVPKPSQEQLEVVEKKMLQLIALLPEFARVH